MTVFLEQPQRLRRRAHHVHQKLPHVQMCNYNLIYGRNKKCKGVLFKREQIRRSNSIQCPPGVVFEGQTRRNEFIIKVLPKQGLHVMVKSPEMQKPTLDLSSRYQHVKFAT